jgi:polyribonucleotide nucleotidyltransferase
MVIPTPIIGSIIGKGGAIINEMNKIFRAKIKISQNNEFFPSTSDRVLAGTIYLSIYLSI